MKKRMYVKPIGIMVSEEMYGNIIDLSDKQEVSISDYVRSALESKLNQETIDEKQSKENSKRRN